MGSSMETNAPAVSRCQSAPRDPTISASRMVNTCTSGLLPMKINATR